jgi:integrase
MQANGWAAAISKFKRTSESQNVVTVGDYLGQVKAVGGLKLGTFEIYARKFRSLVADVFGIDTGASKHDYRTGGYQVWLDKVHGVRLERLTPAKVNAWKIAYLKTASTNPLALKRASVTVRSVLLSSKSLFSPKIRKHLTVALPSPLPFDGVELPKAKSSRYKSEIEPHALLVAAKRELGESTDADNREVFKIILLALGAGLRRDEIDTLTWRQLDFTRNVIRVETTIYTAAKSEESENEVDVDPELMALFRGYMADSQSQFVIQSVVAPRPNAASYHHYRCYRLFKLTVAWLRGKGLTARNAIHCLRKEFGSQVAAQGGIFAASLALRHASITLTRDTYLDKKTSVVFRVAALMDEQPAATPQPATAATA